MTSTHQVLAEALRGSRLRVQACRSLRSVTSVPSAAPGAERNRREIQAVSSFSAESALEVLQRHGGCTDQSGVPFGVVTFAPG